MWLFAEDIAFVHTLHACYIVQENVHYFALSSTADYVDNWVHVLNANQLHCMPSDSLHAATPIPYVYISESSHAIVLIKLLWCGVMCHWLVICEKANIVAILFQIFYVGRLHCYLSLHIYTENHLHSCSTSTTFLQGFYKITQN